jgi:hypothetical protein
MPPRKAAIVKQSDEDTKKLDEFTALLYEQKRETMIKFIWEFFLENGEELINLRDSSGNCLIHNLCMALSDQYEDV